MITNVCDTVCGVVIKKLLDTITSLNGCYAVHSPSYPAYPQAIIMDLHQHKIYTINRIFHNVDFNIEVHDFESEADIDRCTKDVYAIGSEIFNVLANYCYRHEAYDVLINCYDLKLSKDKSIIKSIVVCQAIINERFIRP